MFVDLENAFDRVLTKVAQWALSKLGFVGWIVSDYISM